MTLNIRNTKTDKAEPLRLGVYGDAGCGKTTLGGTFPKPFFFAMGNESGISALSQIDNPCDYALINSPADMDEAVRFFVNHYQERGWRTAAVDTATLLGRMVHMLESDNGNTSMEFTKWTKVLLRILGWRDAIHSCNVHVVWTFHADDVKNGEIIFRRAPKLIGAALKEIIQTLGLLGYLDKYEQEEKKDESGKIIQEQKTIRRFWLKCPASFDVAFEVKNRYENILTALCYAPNFDVLAKFLAPKHITI